MPLPARIFDVRERNDSASGIGGDIDRRSRLRPRPVLPVSGGGSHGHGRPGSPDRRTRAYMAAQQRGDDWTEIGPDPDAEYDGVIEINLDELEPLISRPHSPDSVVPVREVAGTPVTQVLVGSCTNSSYVDLQTVAGVLQGKTVHPSLSFGVTPGSRQVYTMIARSGALGDLIESGARILESACGPCIGMGQAPASGAASRATWSG